jgi:phosphohistidine phosphatase SixA
MRLLVRHAHAGHKRHWSGPDAERPLSIRGWAQAEGLLDTLADLRVERLLTSPSRRCRQTLLPLAAALDLDLESVDDLGTDGDLDRLVDLLAAGDSDGAVLCTHGEVLGELFARLRARGHPRREPTAREKGSTWLLEGAADGRLHARYLPPPAPGTKHRWWWQGMGDTHTRPVEVQRRMLGGRRNQLQLSVPIGVASGPPIQVLSDRCRGPRPRRARSRTQTPPSGRGRADRAW